MSDPKISIIIPVYNADATLCRCVDSILAQTFADFEVLLVNDGSTDSSGEVCDEYSAKDDRVKVFHKANGGASSARNMGIENARGEYVTFIDSDDEILPNFLNDLYVEGYDLVVCGMERSGYNPGIVEPSRNGEVFIESELANVWNEQFSNFVYWFVVCKLYKTSILRQYGLYFNTDMFYAEDFAFLLNYLLHINSYYMVKSHGYKYYATEMHKKYKMSYSQMKKHCDIYEDLITRLEQKCHIKYCQVRDSLYFRYLIKLFYKINTETDKAIVIEELRHFGRHDVLWKQDMLAALLHRRGLKKYVFFRFALLFPLLFSSLRLNKYLTD